MGESTLAGGSLLRDSATFLNIPINRNYHLLIPKLSLKNHYFFTFIFIFILRALSLSHSLYVLLNILYYILSYIIVCTVLQTVFFGFSELC